MYYGVVRAVERNWGWILTLGILQIILGMIALSFVGLTTLLSVKYLGALFVVAGVVEIAAGFQNRKQGHLGAHLFFGALYIVGGFLIFTNPVANAIFLTTLIALLLLVTGIVELVGSVVERGNGWLWFAFLGVVSIVLGYSVLKTPLESSLWLIGTFVGVDMMMRGFAMTSLALTGRRFGKHAPAAVGART